MTNPSIGCPLDMDFEADSYSGAVGTWTDGVFSVDDIVSDVSDIIISCTRSSNTLFTIGTTVVTCDATDLVGNTSADCQFSVIVAGNNSFICHLFF